MKYSYACALALYLVASCRVNYELEPLDERGLRPDGASASGGSASVTGGSGSVVDAGGEAGSPTNAGSGGETCVPSNGGVEACDGLDNDCDGASDDGAPCEAGCFAAVYGTHGYMFCSAPLAWADARAYCAARSMSLIRIDDAQEDAWVLSTASSDPAIATAFAIFLGGSDAAASGEWRWMDGEQFWSGQANGTPVGGLYTNWDSNEPNDQGAGTEDCLGLRSDTGAWSDVRCSGSGAELPFGCESP